MEYEADGRTWTHAFRADRVDDEQLDALLAGAGLRRAAVLTPDGAWVHVVG